MNVEVDRAEVVNHGQSIRLAINDDSLPYGGASAYLTDEQARRIIEQLQALLSDPSKGVNDERT